MDLVKYLVSAGYGVYLVPDADRDYLSEMWEMLVDGEVICIVGTNPKSFEESEDSPQFKLVHQVQNKKFTVGDYTFLRKEGDLILTDGVIEWEGFDIFRGVILQLMTFDEAKKIIDSWI